MNYLKSEKIEYKKSKTEERKRNSLFFYGKLFLIISICEAVIMLILPKLHLSSVFLEAAVDTISLTISSGISIWLFILYPEKKKFQKTFEEETYFLEQQIIALNKMAIISATNAEGKLTFVNENFCLTSGFSREELLGKDNRITNSGYHSKEFFTEMWQTIQSGQIWRGKVRNKKKNGEFYWVDSSIIPLFDKDNKLTNYISIRFDITTEKEMEEIIEIERMKNIHMNRMAALGEMASGIAHEINNPLSVINALIGLNEKILKNQIDVNENSKIFENFEKCQKHVDRISKIIRGLKEFSRSEKLDDFEYFKITGIVKSIQSLIGEKLRHASIKIEYKIEKEIENCELKCNSVQIEQVLVNLINNSFDVLNDLDDRWILVEIKSVDNFIEFSVTDSGNGISHAITEKLMQPFFSTKPVGRGVGLGLSISQGIIENHGGKFFLDQNSENTRFVFQIPKNIK